VGSVIDILQKAVVVMTQEIFWQDIKQARRINQYPPPGKRPIALTVYAPPVELADPFNFDHANLVKNIGMGLSAEPVLPGGRP
jgi:hypothetical protein